MGVRPSSGRGHRLRQQVCTALLAHRPNVIRANASEVMALTGLASQGRGVDATTTTEDAAQAAIKLAQQQCCIVAMTGETDFITNGTHHYRLTGGHALMPRVTTLGCGLSALVAGFGRQPGPSTFGNAGCAGVLQHCRKPCGAAGQWAGQFSGRATGCAVCPYPDDLSSLSQLETLHAV